ncbi:MAG: endopeptidase La [Lentisphaeria bacterium]|nr:endopeptidase La [Lentisphaeria bacterium]
MDNLNVTVAGGGFEQLAPMIILRNPVLFPFSLTQISVQGEANTEAMELAMRRDRLIAVYHEITFEDNEDVQALPRFNCGSEEEALQTGILAKIVKVVNLPDGGIRVLVRSLKRIRHLRNCQINECRGSVYEARISDAVSIPQDQAAGTAKALQQMLAELPLPEEFRMAAANQGSLERLTELLADNYHFSTSEKVLLQHEKSVKQRSAMLLEWLNREVEIHHLGNQIQSEVHEAMSQPQREYFLKEQLRAIRRELGEEFGNPDIPMIEEKLQNKRLPEKVEAMVRKELARLELIPQAAPEYHIAYTYIQWLLDVPWTEESMDTLNLNHAAKILDEDHYGLQEVKDRILEFLAVLQLKPDRKSPILCLAGPPGVGKTSLGQSIARAMNRKFIRAALGGVHDESEIRGHRRTYVGALPGRIIQGMKRAGTVNPVFLLDEIDKLSHDVKGDPASALLEVLDPEQNSAFQDHYLEADYDLSRVFFLTTANMLETIPGPLRDRMEIVELPGYTAIEKREIAKRHLVPRQLEQCGLSAKRITVRLSAINELINYYTREAGVRQLERTVGQLCRKVARKIVSGEIPPDSKVSVNAEMVRELLGPRKFLMDEAEKTPQVGCATGMAWTSCGGTVLPVEVISMPGKGELKLTGSLGKVMQESANAAYSYIRSQAEKWGIAPERFEENNFHIHVPDGATPKDGPSAGVTLATALLSHLTGRAVKPRLAMTGEINLRGHITAVGGIREKVIGALRAGIHTVLLPEANRKDTEDLPEEVKKQVTIHFIEKFDDAAKLALEKEKE